MWDKSHRGLGRRVPEFELWQAPGQNMLLQCVFVLGVEFHLMKGRNSSFWEVGRPEGPSGNNDSSNIFWDHFQLQNSRMEKREKYWQDSPSSSSISIIAGSILGVRNASNRFR